MFNICVKYFEEHKITISTNVDIKKSKTKCIYFSHSKSNIEPAKIMFNNIPLPWVESWPHLGNDLERTNLAIKAKSNMDTDVRGKKRKFIGKFHALRQEFGFASAQVLFKLVNIYGTSFYGSVLWDLGGSAADSLYASWNAMVRMAWNLPNTAHTYFIEDISEAPHLKAILSQRYLTFIHSLLNSKKKCLSQLALKTIYDQGSITGQNINLIASESGYNRFNILNMAPSCVANEIRFSPVPEESKWKIQLLKELLSLCDGELCMREDENEQAFSREELQNLIAFVSTQ